MRSRGPRRQVWREKSCDSVSRTDAPAQAPPAPPELLRVTSSSRLLSGLPDAAQGDVPIPVAAGVQRAELPVVPVGRVQGLVAVLLGRRGEPFRRQARNRVA